MSEKYARLLRAVAHHESSVFPGAWWLSNRFRVIDEEGRDLIDPAEWPQFRKLAEQQAAELGYNLLEEDTGDRRRLLIYRAAKDFDQALLIKRDAWRRGRDCLTRKFENGSYGTWEVYS